jgi:hypothetical protein
MIREFDRVMLTEDLPEYGLKVGDIGAVVDIHGDHAGYEVEFISLEGHQIAVVTLKLDQVSEIAPGAVSIASIRQQVRST